MFRELLNKLDSISENKSLLLIGFIDEFSDGDVWLIKAAPDVAQAFVTLANSVEDVASTGTEYDPESGIMGKVHTQLGNADAPQWALVTGNIPPEVQEELQTLKPINASIVKKLSMVDGDIQEFMADFLWDLESSGYAIVTQEEANYSGKNIRFADNQAFH